MQKLIRHCPVCRHALTVTRLECDVCHTVIENHFQLHPLYDLSPEELHFAEVFIRCRGNIKEVEKELGISYPTVRSKLDGVIAKLGGSREGDKRAQKKERVLKALENGEITAEQAIAELK